MKDIDQYRCFMGKEELHKSLNSLVGILDGIVADGIVNEEECNELKNWYSLHAHLIDKQPFKEILPSIDLALENDSLCAEEVQSILWLCSKYLETNQEDLYFDAITSSIQRLESMLHGIISDGQISDEELKTLSNWLNENEQLCGIYPYDEIYSLLLDAKEDGIITDAERNILRAFFSNFVDPSESFNINENDLKRLQNEYSVSGICAVCPHIEFEGKLFCFTGVSARGKRSDFADLIQKAGGLYNDRVTNDTDYLIVGAGGNPCWAFSCYGRKVEKAMSMRRKGHRIVIVHENDFWDEV